MIHIHQRKELLQPLRDVEVAVPVVVVAPVVLSLAVQVELEASFETRRSHFKVQGLKPNQALSNVGCDVV
jgi:hypothetical protein